MHLRDLGWSQLMHSGQPCQTELLLFFFELASLEIKENSGTDPSIAQNVILK